MIVLDDVLSESLCSAAYDEVCGLDVSWVHYANDLERKRSTKTMVGESLERVSHILDSPLLVGELCRLLGIEGELSGDDSRWGAGIHVTDPGGFLAPHIDYARHPHRDAERRLNVVAFLSPWKDHWGGELCFWDTSVSTVTESVLPKAGRLVAWVPTDDAYHSVKPVTGPRPRVTLASYFLSEPCRPEAVRTRALFVPTR